MVLSNADPSIGYDLATISGRGTWSEWVTGQGFTAHCFGRIGRRSSNLLAITRLLQFCWLHRPQIIYVIGLRAALLARIVRPLIPSVQIVHGIRSSFPKGTTLAQKFQAIERIFRGSTRHYVANSHAGARDLAELIGASESAFSVIHNGLDNDFGVSELEEAREHVVAVVANINQYKGHLEFLRVIKKVKRELSSVRFVLVGRNDAGRILLDAIEAHGLEDVVVVAGYEPKPERVLRVARVFALPSLVIEGCPTSILEAMAMGLPVIAYRIGGIPELVEHGQTGFLVDSGDEAEYARVLVRLLTDERLAKQLGDAGKRVVAERFTLERCARQHANLWHALLGEAPGTIASARSAGR